MNSDLINVSTGPVQVSTQVLQALAASPISHRSHEFRRLYHTTADFLCHHFNVQQAYFITGSGTAANEAMIYQIKLRGGKGLILSNGEFGRRLVEQAVRASLQFIEYNLLWGQVFDLKDLEINIQEHKVDWVLFCHCETSTGVLNNLDEISKICVANNCLCFVDCISTVGTYRFDLSQTAMATASSGKGFASIPGLAIIFSNIKTTSSNQIPAYLDLAYYDGKEGIPFTLSSNLLLALKVSVRQKLLKEQYQLTDYYAKDCFKLLDDQLLLPFNNTNSKVFTISAPGITGLSIIQQLHLQQVIVSWESEYLKKQNWFQVALFGYYEERLLKAFLKKLQSAITVVANTTISKSVGKHLTSS